MVIYSRLVKVSSILVTLICNFIVPILETIAYKVRIGEGCGCASPSTSPAADRRRKHKKLKQSCSDGAIGAGHYHSHNDVKRIKLLLDITVAQNGSQVLNIQASTAKGQGEGLRDFKLQQQPYQKSPGLILRLFNAPSSIMLWFVSKLKQLALDLEAFDNSTCGDISRIKKSPKRRITRSNYRKIIPFFPFNLLGFSNYSAFQMPSITHSCSSTTVAEDTNNLNVSSNEQTRCKRRRNSTEDEGSSLSDEDFSYVELSDASPVTSRLRNRNAPPATYAGHDEVDSDDTADTVTKPTTSSSSSCDNNNPILQNGRNGGKIIIVGLNTSTSEDNCGGGNVTTMTDLDSSSGVVGEEHHVRFSFVEELNEAVNESYNSEDDPDYEPPASCTSSSDSSFATDKGCSDESFLPDGGNESGKYIDDIQKDRSVETKLETENIKVEVTEPRTNGATKHEEEFSPTVSSPASTSNSSKKKKQKNKKQNGTSNNLIPPHPKNLEHFSTGNEDEYKTPDEGEHEGHNPF